MRAMASPFESPRWLRWLSSPGRSLRVAVVTLSAGAAVPVLCSFPYTKVGLGVSPEAPFITLVSTACLAYFVIHLSQPRPQPALFAAGLSAVFGALNGAIAGFLSAGFGSEGASSLSVGVIGAGVGSVCGLAFGIVNAALVKFAHRKSAGASRLDDGDLVAHLASLVFVGLASVLVVCALCSHNPARDGVPWIAADERPLACAIRFSEGLAMVAALVAAFTAQRQRRLRRWLDRVVRGDEPRYRVVPLADGSTDASCSLLARGQRVEAESLLVRVDEEVETADSAYRQMERLTPLARLAP